MPYATNRDRPVSELELSRAPWPAPPLNLFMKSGYKRGVIDLTWDDPTQLTINSRFRIMGVNVYRSFDSEFGPFERVTDILLGASYWRDRTDNELLPDEDVSKSFILFGVCSGSGMNTPRFVFRTQHFPIVKPDSQEVPADSPYDVTVTVDGRPAKVLAVHGPTGEVEIDPFAYANVETQNWDPAVVPGPTSDVRCAYRYTRQLIKTDLAQRIFYRVTTVGIPINCDLSTCQPQDFVETPIENATATNNYEVDKLDHMWKEATRRNRWILGEGGERVKVFLKKNVGVPCPCVPDFEHKQPINDCRICYGTGIIGGYDGPYDIIIAPDDSDRTVDQTERGRTVVHTYETWTGPTPILAHRDFIVKINNDRYSIGGVRFPTNRGMVLQQHFTIGQFDDTDIRYRVPVTNPVRYAAIQFAPTGPEEEASDDVTNNPDIPQERQLRGRTKAWENTEY